MYSVCGVGTFRVLCRDVRGFLTKATRRTYDEHALPFHPGAFDPSRGYLDRPFGWQHSICPVTPPPSPSRLCGAGVRTDQGWTNEETAMSVDLLAFSLSRFRL
ncbi:hypothetical protein RRG08_014040 [Elysia crispata]|uniref:Uncharacterized protein n=1 Tax=Elysia crispata TaxID=231223 RepID=A0AAE0ZZY2_9GAST|nr:hypothetical protein RRG08_014040 [Elysia crispata]